ncbi:MAG: ABC transporter permease [Deltaproteobacteria bacterium]|nr:ABC transporter permease [Deltaproteobacteria bacterium]MCB9488207.1 ABC transporter permease [Deltaproteobacteria bacterium]
MYRLLYFLRNAAANIRGELVASLLTLAVVTISFVILGAYVLVGMNVSRYVDEFAGQIQIIFYLEKDATAAEVETFVAKLREHPTVRRATYVTPAEALVRLQQDLADAPEFLQDLEESPVPASVEVELAGSFRHRPEVEPLVNAFSQFRVVESVDAGDEFDKAFSRILTGLWLSGVVIGIFLMISAVFIVANTIRLTIIRRREEIENMRLVGATNAFVKAPFLIEGIAMGAGGAMLALVLLLVVHRFVMVPMTLEGPALSVFTGFDWQFAPARFLFIAVALGALIGWIGAQFSVGRYLKA